MPVTTRNCFAVLLLFILSVPVYVRAQQNPPSDPYLLVNTLNDNSGLPQNSIITQYIDTSSGMLWLATFGGLVRYNGISLKSFDRQHYDSLLTNKLVNMFRTSNGEVYAMNVHSQLLKIGKQDIYINQSLTWIWQQYALFVWFRGVLNSPAQIQRLGIHAFGRPPYYPGQENWSAGFFNYYLAALPDNRFAVTNKNNELMVYADSLLRFRQAVPVITDSAKLFYSKGLLYVLDDRLNGACYDLRGPQPVPAPQALSRLQPLREQLKNKKTVLYYNELNDQAVLSAGQELVVLNTDKEGIFPAHRMHVGQLPKSISSILFYPAHQTLFIGTTTEGLFVFRKNNFRQLLAPDLAMNINSMYAQLLTDSNHLLTSRGVTFDLRNNESVYAKEKNHMSSPFSRDAAGGYYWNNENTVQYQPAGNEPARIVYRKNDSTHRENIIRFVWSDQETKKLWIFESFKWGYFKDGQYQVVVSTPQNKLPSPCYYSRNGNTVYLATDRGMVLLDERSNRWRYATGTLNKETRFVAADPKHSVCWFSTYGFGFGAYLMDKDSVLFFPQDAHQYLSSTHALIEDDRHDIWLPTNKGLFRTQKSQLLGFIKKPNSPDILYYDYFDRQDGLTTNEFNGGAQPIFTHWKNELLLSTINGILRFSPDDIPGNAWKEPLYIDFAQTRSRAFVPVPETGQEWEFDENERIICWVLNRACWSNPYGMRVEYRMDDNQEWKVIEGTKLMTRWERLSGGKHTLHIRQFSGVDGKYMEQSIPFGISLYWYEEWWVWLLALLGIILIVYLTTRRFSVLKKQVHVSRKKDEVLSETLSLMETGNAMLDASNMYKSKMVYVLMHDVTVQVASIEKVSGIVSRNIENINQETIKTVMKEINDASRNLLIISDQLIQWSNIQDTVETVSIEPADIHAMVEDVRDELGDRFAWRNNKLVNNVPEDMQIQTKLHLLHHLIFNLVLHANKYMKDGIIEIEASQVEGYTIFIVKDNGTTMDTELRELLIQSSVSHDASVVYSGQRLWHIGYQIIFDLVQVMKGEIEIKAGENDNGLIIAIGLPPLNRRNPED